jgi:hemin uptake protein HemP
MATGRNYSAANEKRSYLGWRMADSPLKTPTDGPAQALAAPAGRPADRVVSTRELLAGAHRVWIEHETVRYLLQVTRSGKLILTK